MFEKWSRTCSCSLECSWKTYSLESIVGDNWFFVINWLKVNCESLVIKCILHSVRNIKCKLDHSADETQISIRGFVNDFQVINLFLIECCKWFKGVRVQQSSHFFSSVYVRGLGSQVKYNVLRWGRFINEFKNVSSKWNSFVFFDFHAEVARWKVTARRLVIFGSVQTLFPWKIEN